MSLEVAGQPVLILKEGTSRAVGREALHANILAAKVIAEAVKTSLGPRGLDKMLVDSFGDITITSDGATILDEMDVEHPAAKMIVEVAKAQDDEVGDGTTTAVVLAGEMLSKGELLLDKNIHPTTIVEGYKHAMEVALKFMEEIAIKVRPEDEDVLKKVAMVAMASKLVAEYREYLADIATKAVLQVAEKTPEGYKVDIDNIKVEKKQGESVFDTRLIHGVVLDKEVVHPGMPKRVENAKIALINAPLEVEKTEFDAKISIENPEQMKAFLEEEENILSRMVEKIANAGSNVVLCEKGIDDVAQHFLAKKGMLAVRRIKQSDMEKLARATGGKIVNNIDDLKPEDLGYAKLVEERKVGEDKMTFVEGCLNPKAVTILIRGGAERVVDEAERSVHDALMVVRDVVMDPRVVAGGGSPEAEVARRLRKYAEGLPGREQLAVSAFADALESIPFILAENAGMDPLDAILQIRSRHEKGEIWVGVDPFKGKVEDAYKQDVLEPLVVKLQAIKSAGEAATMILRIDDIIAASRKEEKGPSKGPEEGGKEEEIE